MGRVQEVFRYVDDGAWPRNYPIEKIRILLEELKKDQFRRLGVIKKVTLRLDNLHGKACGYYSPSNEEIVIDRDIVENAEPLITVHILLHECYHCAQIALASVYESLSNEGKALFFFDNARRYLADIERYSSVDDETRGNLYLEKDADDYADNMLREYLTLYRKMSLRRIDNPMGLSLYRWAFV